MENPFFHLGHQYLMGFMKTKYDPYSYNGFVSIFSDHTSKIKVSYPLY